MRAWNGATHRPHVRSSDIVRRHTTRARARGVVTVRIDSCCGRCFGLASQNCNLIGLRRVGSCSRAVSLLGSFIRSYLTRFPPGNCERLVRSHNTGKMEGHILVESSFSAIINTPIEKVDIPCWCFTLPKSEYQSCFPAHRRCRQERQ